MNGRNSKEENKNEERPVVVRNTTDLQRLKLEKLMKNPDKPVVIPEKPKGRSMPPVPDFVRNVMGSSAGAGSGEFHVYRHLRRKEYARQKFIHEKSEREKLDEEYHTRIEENKKKAEEKTAKKRAKRQKRKLRAKDKGKKKMKTESPSPESSEKEDSESEKEEEKNEESTVVIITTEKDNKSLESSSESRNEKSKNDNENTIDEEKQEKNVIESNNEEICSVNQKGIQNTKVLEDKNKDEVKSTCDEVKTDNITPEAEDKSNNSEIVNKET